MRNTFLMKNATGGKIHRGELQNIYLTHRLDSPTSGIMAACDRLPGFSSPQKTL